MMPTSLNSVVFLNSAKSFVSKRCVCPCQKQFACELTLCMQHWLRSWKVWDADRHPATKSVPLLILRILSRDVFLMTHYRYLRDFLQRKCRFSEGMCEVIRGLTERPPRQANNAPCLHVHVTVVFLCAEYVLTTCVQICVHGTLDGSRRGFAQTDVLRQIVCLCLLLRRTVEIVFIESFLTTCACRQDLRGPREATKTKM